MEDGEKPGDAARAVLRFLVGACGQLCGVPLVGGASVGEGYVYGRSDGLALDAGAVAALAGKFAELRQSGGGAARTAMSGAEAASYFASHGLSHAAALVDATATSVPVYAADVGGARIVRLAVTSSMGEATPFAAAPDAALELRDGKVLALYGGRTTSATLVAAQADHGSWGAHQGVTGLGALNALGEDDRGAKDYALRAEFRQEAKLAALASAVDLRASSPDRRVGVVCIAGPTSSGKTTFATKLAMYLRNLGHVAVGLTVDHYYLPLDRQPKFLVRGERTDVDYDAVESMDAVLVNEHINALLNGEAVRPPIYNMKSGMRDGVHEPFSLPGPESLLIIEGIHALNPSFTGFVPAAKVFKVFISPLTALQLDDANCVKTTDARLLRRMCRDSLFRGHDAAHTLRMWPNVRNGEGKWIFPHQDAVDFVMNSATEYELRVLKPLVAPLLETVPADSPHKAKALSLLGLLALVKPLGAAVVTDCSLLREFIGGGAFDCH